MEGPAGPTVPRTLRDRPDGLLGPREGVASPDILRATGGVVFPTRSDSLIVTAACHPSLPLPSLPYEKDGMPANFFRGLPLTPFPYEKDGTLSIFSSAFLGPFRPPILKLKVSIRNLGQPGILESQACPNLGVGELLPLAPPRKLRAGSAQTGPNTPHHGTAVFSKF